MIDYDYFSTDYTFAAFVSVIALLLLFFARSKVGLGRNFPAAPGALPFIGHTLQLTDSDKFVDVVTRWADEVGKDGIFEFSLLGQRWVVLCSTESIMKAAALRPLKLQRSSTLGRAIDSLGIHGVFNAEGKSWMHQRKIVSPTLNSKNVNDYFDAIKFCANRLVTKWENEANDKFQVCALTDLANHSLDVVALTILGMDFDSLNCAESTMAQNVRDVFQAIFQRSLSPVPYWKIPLIGGNIDGGQKASDQVLGTMSKLVKDYRQKKASNDHEEQNRAKKVFIEKAIDLCDRDNAKLSDDQVVGNLASLILAGTDTTSSTLAFGLWEIAQDSNLQLELQDEIAESGNASNNLSMSDVRNGYPRLHSFMYEVLRTKGPGPFLFLEPASALEFEGDIITPGTTVIMMLKSSQGKGVRDVPRGPNGEGPEFFCPQRWLLPLDGSKPNGKVTVLQPCNKFGGYLPFGNSARVCPGQQLAEVEILTTLIYILQTFEITPMKNHPALTVVTRFTEIFDQEMKLDLKLRL